MEPAKPAENHCACKKPVKGFCQRCKEYVCADCQVTKHFDHDTEIVDLAEKCTRYLADYQKLSRAATLMADRRQVHIKEESIDGIVEEIKTKLAKAKESLQGDIGRTAEQNLKNIGQSPLVQEFARKKAELSGKPDDPLQKLKTELTAICKDLLHNISQNKYETADKLIFTDKLKQYEEEIKKITEASANDLEFIQEIRKLKQTTVEYSYDPMAIMGMIKVNTQVKKPSRIIQFDREKNAINIFNVDSHKAVTTVVNSGFIMPFRFMSAEVCNNVYLNGGDNDHGLFLKSMFLYDELRGGLIPLASMQQGRSRHAVVPIDDKHCLYVIGGETEEGVTKNCEVYDIKENVWRPAPRLNETRCGHSACLLDGKAIFVVGGWNEEYLGSVESLEMGEDKRWETLRLKKHHTMTPVQICGLVPLKENELLVFGGYRTGEEMTKECAILDVRALTVAKQDKELLEADCFIASEAKRFGDKLYAFGYTKGGVHTFDIGKAEWAYVSQDKL